MQRNFRGLPAAPRVLLGGRVLGRVGRRLVQGALVCLFFSFLFLGSLVQSALLRILFFFYSLGSIDLV